VSQEITAGSAGGSSKGKKWAKKKAGRGALAVILDLLAILFLVIILGAAVGAIVATDYVYNILDEMSSLHYDVVEERIQKYRAYFDNLQREGNDVRESAPLIDKGEKFYLWRVTRRGESEGRLYKWKVDLQTNEVTAVTSAAKELDAALGFGGG
jgi:hypothetical protein